MQTIRPLLIGKSIHSVPPTVTVLEAARTMCDRRIGAIMVCDGSHPVGVFSERDLMERVVVRGKDPARVPVSEVMTRDIVTASPNDSPVECMRKMQEHGCRHLPVVEGGQVIAMLSLRDLLRIEIDEKNEEIRWMNAYIHDVPPDRMF
ncbi:MAG TPA: CBS domain-containing protein [Candidatus Udaeobacter sp.]|nr:CBS domain-containing protein [Candidatus Udaeobacter sp.]